jgi:hypothetical protein
MTVLSTPTIRRTVRRTIPAVLAALALAACAQPGSPATPGPTSTPAPASPSVSATTGQPPASATDLPTLTPPTAPPSRPTDDLPTDVVVGRITLASPPCLRLVTDDGAAWALYGSDIDQIRRDDVVRVKVAPLRLKIYCGPGQHAQIVSIEVVQ